jgi:hypothetical protein
MVRMQLSHNGTRAAIRITQEITVDDALDAAELMRTAADYYFVEELRFDLSARGGSLGVAGHLMRALDDVRNRRFPTPPLIMAQVIDRVSDAAALLFAYTDQRILGPHASLRLPDFDRRSIGFGPALPWQSDEDPYPRIAERIARQLRAERSAEDLLSQWSAYEGRWIGPREALGMALANQILDGNAPVCDRPKAERKSYGNLPAKSV